MRFALAFFSLAALLATPASAQSSRLFFSPTAHAPEGVSFGTRGLAPSATLGVGPASFRAGIWAKPSERTAYAIPAVTLAERGNLTLGAAAFGAAALAPERRDTHGMGLVLGLATFGTDRESVTVALGGGATVESALWSTDDEAIDALAVLVVGAEAEVVPGVRLMTENVRTYAGRP